MHSLKDKLADADVIRALDWRGEGVEFLLTITAGDVLAAVKLLAR